VRLEWVRRAWDEHRSGRADHRLFLWTWLSMQHSAEALAVDHRERAAA
jgi:asparagine synthase (glutamine-hydrolysing)